MSAAEKRPTEEGAPEEEPAKRKKAEQAPAHASNEAAAAEAANESAVAETAEASALERPEIAASCRRAQFWYYKDTYNQLQGPFYPGELHDWFAAKHFLPSQMVAPSFQGEVPQDFYRIEQLFDLDAAFHCDSDVAWKPPEEPPPPEPELSDAELQQMLKDRLLNTNNRNGPVFAGKWVDN